MTNLDQARAMAQRLRDAGFTGETLGYADILDALIAEVARLREALEKLARLGNGDRYGNSIGNEIARAALESKT